jgi:hypothetical protein
MNHIKKFIERVSHMESHGTMSLNLSANDARMLRDEVAKLMADTIVVSQRTHQESAPTVVKGGQW